MFKKLKRRLNRRNKGGYTLVEVIVASALLGILLLGIMLFVSPVMKMLQTEQQASRGTIVASTIHQYLTRTLRNTTALKTFTQGNKDDISAALAHDDFKAITDWLSEGSRKNNYELRCLCIHSEYNPNLQQTSNLIYQEYLVYDEGTGTWSIDYDSETLVFNECFYGGLFPEIIIDRADKKYVYVTAEQTYEEPAPGEEIEEKDIVPGVEFYINLYDDDKLEPTSKVYTGYGLIELYNVSSTTESKKKNIFKTSSLTTDPNNKDTLIFYLARKINITTTST